MSVTFARGFSAAGLSAGISSVPGKSDMALVVNDGPLDVAAGVFTSNRFSAAPVQWSREVVKGGHAKGMVINSGCANACTGAEGLAQSRKTAEAFAQAAGTTADKVLVGSTGLIGELLPLDHVLSGIEKGFPQLAPSEEAGVAASQAILTTDTQPKRVCLQVDGYRLGGMVKGSGMIAPQLATMICVLTTDAVVSAKQADAALRKATSTSFDRIDVDGCMSTNDTVVLLASGASGITPDMEEFTATVSSACSQLARKIVGDGEGSSHDIKVSVTDASSEEAALACARAVAASNLFKCAVAGNDPNWGRIVSSFGTVPEQIAPYDPAKVTVDINGIRVCDGGAPGQPRELVDMTPREVHVDIALHSGSESATIWTDDLTHEYVHINSEYES
ncbi:MAG: bifunctional glutamate N-acetyltransferase/amino-acid acetyltransferase ArgJ [Bifidobacteriaceae bacterium]|jgi:glutamate N-acetyltransferase/amino-acid N-acetyltransferase|nr:bifunctional glutamate N-acetyltransferase/amino-acid acetyltransferase ArgJ [Bifidobacteriaceae bacterium]MCI1978130.1 bifunctional glutamate N-acetyltransferase/amino-acid acetyltransferase ArgJ [Bifidobacteriaceae bacterium]